MNKIAYLITIVFVLCSRLCLVSEYTGDQDPSMYILSLVKMVGSVEDAPSAFNHEMSFGYYWLISVVYKLVHHDIAKLILIQNYINATSGVLVILFFGLLVKRLTDDVVSIFGMVILTFDHSLWNWSLYGHPGVISITFFLISLYFFDRSITSDTRDSGIHKERIKQFGYLAISILSGLTALIVRVDILFVFASFFLLYIHRRKDENKSWRCLFLFYGFVFLSYMVAKYLTLGYVVNPSGGTIAYHVIRNLTSKFILTSPVTNIGLFASGMGVLFVLAGLVSIVCWTIRNPRYMTALVLSVFPVFILCLFEHMDFSRISIVVHPVLAFFAGIAFSRIIPSRAMLNVWHGIVIIIIAYIAQTAMVYAPLKKIWVGKFPYQPTGKVVVRPIPIGFFYSDRKNRWENEERLYQHALFLSLQKGNYLVICSRLHYHRMVLLLTQLCHDADLRKSKTPIPHYIISNPNAKYCIFCRVNLENEDILYQLFYSGSYRGYLVYFINNVQHAFSEGLLPKGYKLFSMGY